MPTWSIVLLVILPIVAALIAVVLTFIFVKKMFEKQIKENPPINEKMIRAMFSQMGRKPSEAQVKAVMRSMQNPNNKKK